MLASFLIAFALIPVIEINILEQYKITENKFNWSVSRSSPEGQETNTQVGKTAFSVRRQSQGEY